MSTEVRWKEIVANDPKLRNLGPLVVPATPKGDDGAKSDVDFEVRLKMAGCMTESRRVIEKGLEQTLPGAGRRNSKFDWLPQCDMNQWQKQLVDDDTDSLGDGRKSRTRNTAGRKSRMWVSRV